MSEISLGNKLMRFNWRDLPKQLLALSSQRAEIAAAGLVLVIVLMMVLPLPTLLVDMLIAVNIAIALLLIALSLYMPGPQAFTSFPSVLLLTTLFRLGIEISTSRLILLQGDAGEIVQTFGHFVVGGNLVVGLIVYLIIAIVQFLVVTKGAERVAEVSARFTLDAIPGKQMAIDSDLRAGMINPLQAREARARLAKESQMHGAMDGAMKFVKGDAIAGMVILLVNLIGGIAVGVLQNHMSAGDALTHYAVLSIGDGLVAQIPALLISITSGMLITRSADEAEKASTAGKEIAAQITSQPKAWIITGAACWVFALLPGMPWWLFLLLGAALASVGGWKLYLAHCEEQAQQVQKSWQARAENAIPDDRDVQEFRPVRNVVLSLPPGLLAGSQADVVVRLSRRVRNQLVLNYGLTVPVIEIGADPDLIEDEFKLTVQDVVVHKSRLRLNQLCLLLDASSAELAAEPDDALYQERGACWVASEQVRTHGLDEQDVLTNWDYFKQQFEQLLFECTPRFVGLTEIRAIINWMEHDNPIAAKELSQVLSLPRLTEVIRSLLIERVSIRNLGQIIEALVSWAPKEKDIANLTEYVRISLGAQICQEFAVDDILHAILLEADLEESIRSALRQSAQGYYLALDQETSLEIIAQIKQTLANLPLKHPRPVLLVTQDIRRFVRRMVQDELPCLYVLSFSELSSRQTVNPLAHISI